jgi:hypothetical protein
MVSVLEATIWCTGCKVCFQIQLAPLHVGKQGSEFHPTDHSGTAVQVHGMRTRDESAYDSSA